MVWHQLTKSLHHRPGGVVVGICEEAMSVRNRPNRHRRLCQMIGLTACFCLAFASPAFSEEGPDEPPRTLQLPLDESADVPDESLPDEPVAQMPDESEEAPADDETTTVTEFEFRSLALTAEHSGISSPVTENVWVMDRVQLSSPPPSPPLPQTLYPPEGVEYATYECYSDADSCSLGWSEPLVYSVLPQHLLWQPPLANQREPHMFGKFTNLNDESTIETAIGAQFGLLRWAPPSKPYEGIQLDGFAAVFTRFNSGRLLVTSDFRVGAPITYAKGPWQVKFGYEHTSTHLGDEFIEATGRMQEPHVRDEFVLGLAHRLSECIRVYAQAGYSFITSDIIGEDRDRYDLGVEWMKNCPTDWRGRPFAAIDLDLRSDQDYTANVTVQVGWHWKTLSRRSGRFLIEYYTGKSPYGQFFQDDEEWIGVGGAYDW